jgi:hypothetical protein
MPQWAFNDEDTNPMEVKDEVVPENDDDANNDDAIVSTTNTQLGAPNDEQNDFSVDLDSSQSDDDEFVPDNDYQTPNLDDEDDDCQVTFATMDNEFFKTGINMYLFSNTNAVLHIHNLRVILLIVSSKILDKFCSLKYCTFL